MITLLLLPEIAVAVIELLWFILGVFSFPDIRMEETEHTMGVPIDPGKDLGEENHIGAISDSSKRSLQVCRL